MKTPTSISNAAREAGQSWQLGYSDAVRYGIPRALRDYPSGTQQAEYDAGYKVGAAKCKRQPATTNAAGATQPEVLRRTFAAKTATTTDDRNRFNADVLTSEYYPSQRFLVRVPALMSDGSANPAQPFHNRTFRTKAEAAAYLASL